jgi:hypothetical protein
MEAKMAEAVQWEYKVISVGGHFGTADAVVEAKLNELGLEGWEAVNIYLATGGGKVSLVLKRPLTETNRRRRAREQVGV